MHWITQVCLLLMLIAIAAGLEGIEKALIALLDFLKEKEKRDAAPEFRYPDPRMR